MLDWLIDRLADYFRSRWARFMLWAALFVGIGAGVYFVFAFHAQSDRSKSIGPLGSMIFGVIVLVTFIAVTLASFALWLFLYVLGVVSTPISRD